MFDRITSSGDGKEAKDVWCEKHDEDLKVD
jgi:hypothetical protein